ncbi:putative structural protein [Xanthomonas phage XaC1]|nr:putative structural protein [Xanthomonas phage XaC1]
MSSVLDKFGVPIPGGGRSSMKQPKPKNKFRILLFGFGAANDGTFITIDTNNVGAPNQSFAKTEVHSYNSVSNFKGKYTWEEIEVAFRDTVGSQPLKALYNQMRREFNPYSQESRKSASQYKFEMWIQVLDGSNSDETTNLYQGTLSTWVCQGCFIVSTNFGEWDYSSSESQLVTFSVQPDYCVLLNENGDAMGDEVSGNGTPETANGMTVSQHQIDSNTLKDQNFFRGQ